MASKQQRIAKLAAKIMRRLDKTTDHDNGCGDAGYITWTDPRSGERITFAEHRHIRQEEEEEEKPYRCDCCGVDDAEYHCFLCDEENCWTETDSIQDDLRDWCLKLAAWRIKFSARDAEIYDAIKESGNGEEYPAKRICDCCGKSGIEFSVWHYLSEEMQNGENPIHIIETKDYCEDCVEKLQPAE